MGIVKSSASAVGKLIVILTLAITFMIGMFGVFYIQLRGEEFAIPKVVGKNFNEGRDELNDVGLRIKKIASRYSNEEPNTILEQRPRAGTTAKSGLMISVVVSEKSPDGIAVPTELKDDDEVIGEIERQPELKIDKEKPKAKAKKTSPKTRDVIKDKTEDTEAGDKTDTGAQAQPGTGTVDGQKPPVKPVENNPPPALPKSSPKTPPKPKEDSKKPNTSAGSMERKVSFNS